MDNLLILAVQDVQDISPILGTSWTHLGHILDTPTPIGITAFETPKNRKCPRCPRYITILEIFYPFFLRFFLYIHIYPPLLLKPKKHLGHLVHLVLPFSPNGSSCPTSVQDVQDVTPKSPKTLDFLPLNFQTIYLHIISYIFFKFSIIFFMFTHTRSRLTLKNVKKKKYLVS